MKIFYFLISIVVLCSCSASKVVSQVQSIKFGSGGGFTGAVNQYELEANGSLSVIAKGDTSQLKVVSKEQMEKILSLAESVKTIKMNEPKNMYQFIEINYKQDEPYRWVWGLGRQDLPSELNELFETLTNLTK
ncbi:hypothetical protein [Fulvivirga ligni]|uniref:hypothetical protein n=1 Tax=Fulvivirga ligni TaxID=2904246 RepID=UPI001F458203|nr:hypothetical protein [Fulvivirga ligni]UII19765.1 hypothetical protein LVD16_18135 [Fulvivirga ligni]